MASPPEMSPTLSAGSPAAEPMIWRSSGSNPSACRLNSDGSSIRLARSPVAPNSRSLETGLRVMGAPFLERQARGLIDPDHQVEVLPRRSGGALAEIVERRDQPGLA